ncbi:helix-turn-helix transcriptional regulator [Nonomuraea sp. NPDC046802]|uniref:helix-turn-helix domain-containing protein n=1 Tax=Nonomuraea sp. NPDC046802 TaxID=3154919 RepID=UPI0033E79EB8
MDDQARALAGKRLAQLRQQTALSMEATASKTGVTTSTVFRAEHGTAVRSETIQALLTGYGVRDAVQRRYVLDLATGQRASAWYDACDVPLSMAASWNLERQASEIWSYGLQFIPPLLQTPEYARAVCRISSMSSAPAIPIESGVRFTLTRQQLLQAETSTRPQYWAVIDESALIRSIGSPDVQVQQLDALIDHAKQEGVVLQVARLQAPRYLPCTGPFSLYRFASTGPDDVVAVHSFADHILRSREAIDPYVVAFNVMAAYATHPGSETLDLLHLHRASAAEAAN